MGLGYVGLPLAVAFAQKGLRVIGFDISKQRIEELTRGKDHTGEVAPALLRQRALSYTADAARLREADYVIVAVPTPVHENKKPDLRPVKSASELVGKNLKKGAIVVYESTVWPGLTEDFCVPIIEKLSRKKCGRDWFIAYSPERINPGDKAHTLKNVVKIVAGMNARTRKRVAALYRRICAGGVFAATSIRVAEAAKVIENTQRDLNIALMNELAMLFKKLGISIRDVLDAAFTKWNFGRYYPGMVGGHCIPVDPYYLTALAERAGYHPKVILAGRAINDAMPKYVVSLLEEGIKENQKSNIKNQNYKSKIKNGQKRILILGLTFKENIPDTRNSPAKYVIRELLKKGYAVDTHDPLVTKASLAHEKFGGTFLVRLPKKASYDGIVITVAHDAFRRFTPQAIRNLLVSSQGTLVDVRGVLAKRPPNGVVYKML